MSATDNHNDPFLHALEFLKLVEEHKHDYDPDTLQRVRQATSVILGSDPCNEDFKSALAILQHLHPDFSPEPSNPTSPPEAFPRGHGQFPNNPLIAAGMQAIWKGGKKARHLQGGWSESEGGRVTYQHLGGRGGRILVYPNLVHSAADSLPTTQALWSFVENLNPFTGDVALAVLAQLVEPSQGDRPKYPLLQPVRITADAILRYKGIQRWGLERRLQEERVAKEMEYLRSLTFDVESFPTFNPETGRRDQGCWEGDRLFDIVKVERIQETFFGESEVVQVAWLVRAGHWAYWWLNPQGRVYLARMARVLLELDHQGTAMAKKLGQRLILLAGAIREFQKLCIDRLLEDVGELPEPSLRDKKWAGRIRDRFDTALLALQEANIIATVQWPDGSGPEDPDRSKGWVQKWLTSCVHITMPSSAPPPAPRQLPAPPCHYARKKARLNPEQRIEGTAIRAARQARGLGQQALADLLTISRKHLSDLENDKKLPSRELAKKIHGWLESQ